MNTTDPEYYKWTQWIFLKLFENWLAYEQDLPINYCPSCKTGLANEEVLWDFSCERCGTQVEKKKIRQWVLAITKYAERLLADVDNLDWPEGIKDMQRNWIGKSEGCEFELKKSDDEIKTIRVYTTRVDTVYGMTYAVIAPDHPDVHDFIEGSESDSCLAYIKKANSQSDQDRTADDKEKTWVFTGSYVINPYNGEQVPLWIADYVLGNYGTWAVMAVPAHDERDFEFAKKYDLEIKKVVAEYSILTWEYAPREWFDTREKTCATIIVEHPDEEKYLVQDFENGELWFTGWGLEWDETPQEAAIRELEEESWLIHTSEMKLSGIMVWHGFKERKQTNCKDPDFVFFTKAQNLEWFQLNCHENVNYKNIWLTKNEILENNRFKSHHKKQFQDYLKWEHATTYYWILMESWDYNGLTSQEAKEKFTQLAEEKLFGHKKVNYKLRDWLFSRQRYWGEPIPVVHCETCWIVGEKEENLPILLPETDNFEPSGDGTSPLTLIDEFVNTTCPKCDGPAKRETNTMPQWWGSCWYYLRFMDNKNSENLVGSEVEKYWGQVDSYVGGAEHAVLHLLYARFWHKFLFDIWVVSTNEPFYRLRNQGMILGMSYRNAKWKLIADDMVDEKWWKYYDSETWEELEKIPAKMSKSLKNVINPDDIVQQYGADTLRMYEMYMADFKDAAPWDPSSIVGVRRFLDKFYSMMTGETPRPAKSDDDAMRVLHKTIKKVEIDIENYKFNTAIAQMMILLNTGEPQDTEKNLQWKRAFIQLLHPFAPHMAEECWELVAPERQDILKVYFATGNDGKITRAQSVLDNLKSKITLDKIPELIEVEETATTPLECALQKIEAYKNKGYKVPIMVADTSVYFEGQDFDPTKVRRTALESAGKKESELSKHEIAEIMIDFYKNKAKQAGWSIDIYYIDACVLLLPNGELKAFECRREYTLTDTHIWDTYTYAPMRGLCISKITWKRAHETTMKDYNKEFTPVAEAFAEIFELQGDSIFFTSWPKYDEAMTIDSEVTIWVQVLGKVRGQIQISVDEDKDSVLEKAKSEPSVAKWLEWKELIKEIYVPGKIVNLVVK